MQPGTRVVFWEDAGKMKQGRVQSIVFVDVRVSLTTVTLSRLPKPSLYSQGVEVALIVVDGHQRAPVQVPWVHHHFLSFARTRSLTVNPRLNALSREG